MPPAKKVGGDPEILEIVDKVLEAKEAGAKAPPMPRPPSLQNSLPLVDIPCIYLNDRSCWPEFKRGLTECGLIWNLSEWMNTIVYKGTEWNLIRDDKGTDLAAFFPIVEKTGAGDGKISKTSALGAKLVGLLSRPTTMDDLKPSAIFCCLSMVEFEDERRLPARQKLWNWLVRSLRGTRSTPGPYHYLIDEIQVYDISYLFKRLVDVLDQITICSLDDELETIIKMDYKPQTQNIFSYLGDLRKAIKRLHDINERLPESGRIHLPDSYVRSRLIRAARQVPVYKPVLDAILISDIMVWSKMTSEELYHRLETVCANDQAAQTAKQNYSTPTYDSVTANSFQTNMRQERTNEKEKKPPCHSFAKGSCTRNPCRFSHVSAPEHKQSQSQSHSQALSQKNAHPKAKCHKCGSEGHTPKDCAFNGKCGHCGRMGHMESVCNAKKAGKPRVLFSHVDGGQIYANMFRVEVPMAQDPAPESNVGIEKFFADTGANQSLHPNGRSAVTYSRLSLDISTAASGKSMKSEGVGAMELITPDGEQCPGFNNVIFSSECAQRLASVGLMCDAGLVFVFTNNCLTTYKESEVQVQGKYFTCDARDKKTGLYPLSLYRKKQDKGQNARTTLCPLPAHVYNSAMSLSVSQKKEKKSEKFTFASMPEAILDGECMPIALLAKTYIKEGLSDVDRLHAKCGDVGIKYLKRAFPSLKIPKKYRCEFCIEGKIHKFGHAACKPGERTEYLPGVCIHSDHSGPYAKSRGGARYSQLFIDRGSGYLWAFREKKKTDHYDVAPQVFLDSQALSGRPVQIFHSDGEGVFSGGRTVEILQEGKIRSEFAAPYDSNTNPFVERARRTVFEGVCTALLRAGASASWWGEAEAHKIFTINNLPTVPDPEAPGKFLSKKNLLVGDKRPFNLERLMAFGTAVTCYVPLERRRGGKEPAQRRSFRGVLLGYIDGMPAYRVWDIEAKKIRSVSFNFTISHEGYYPFRDKNCGPLTVWRTLQIFRPWSMEFYLLSNGKNLASTRKRPMKFFKWPLAWLWTSLSCLRRLNLLSTPLHPLLYHSPPLRRWRIQNLLKKLANYRPFGGMLWKNMEKLMRRPRFCQWPIFSRI